MHKKADTVFEKIAKQKLVKFLEGLGDADEIASYVKSKGLGKVLGKNRSLKTLGEGGEGVAELVGDPKHGVSVRKFTDMDSPIVSTQTVIDKVKDLKKLNKSPETKGLFSEYRPGSFGLSKSKNTSVMNTEYVPSGTSSLPRRQILADKAQQVLGKNISDVEDNPGNVRKKVIDFLPASATNKGKERLMLLESMVRKGEGGSNTKRYNRTMEAIRNDKTMEKTVKYLDTQSPTWDKQLPQAIKNLPNAKGKPLLDYVNDVDLKKWERSNIDPKARLKKMKTDFYN